MFKSQSEIGAGLKMYRVEVVGRESVRIRNSEPWREAGRLRIDCRSVQRCRHRRLGGSAPNKPEESAKCGMRELQMEY